MKCYKVMSNITGRTCKIFKNIYTEGSFKTYLFCYLSILRMFDLPNKKDFTQDSFLC